MSAKETPRMWARFIVFIVGSFAVLMLNMWIMNMLYPQAAKKTRPAEKVAAQQAAENGKKTTEPKKDAPTAKVEQAAKPTEEVKKPEEQEVKAEVEPGPPPQWITLGSASPNDPYRMLVTLTNKGAAVERVELNGKRFHNLEDDSGYLGYVAMAPIGDENGYRVQVVGEGTPAALAGLKKDDVITAFGGEKVATVFHLKRALAKSKPKQTVELTIQRQGKELKLPVTLARHPMEVIQPEGSDPLSFLLTLHQIDKLSLAPVQEKDAAKDKAEDKKVEKGFRPSPLIGQELAGLDLRTGTWNVVRSSQTEAVFSRTLPKRGLEIIKTYRLAKVPAADQNSATYGAYHLEFDVAIRNIGDQERQVAYQLDGPTGLPIEGYWYANKVSRSWSASGLRDVVVSLEGNAPKVISAPQIANDDLGTIWKDPAVTYVGVDAQYFASVLIPQQKAGDVWFAEGQPLRVGPVEVAWPSKTDTSFRLVSKTHDLKPGDEFTHTFKIFAGPKKPDLLAKYGLGELVYYGWFSWVAIPMLWLLHSFYAVIGNYGIAIILLTVVVRLAMFPLSRKQALGAQKMQELQPEIKKLAEKYKNNPEQRMKAQSELFKKHNYHPASGCLPVFLQLPIFVGLYNSLRVDVELRQAPLISEAIHWCSNLAAPDMLFKWTSFMPEFVTSGQGMLGLGPYFNLLPLLTVVLFLWQQQKMMPPPADEQAAIQQNVMKFMMIFIGLMFFKVPSGLCVYFIASSIWGIAERKFLPKPPTASVSADNAPQTKPPAAAVARNGSDRDGSAARKTHARKKS
jgi:YidC/Oxa1 family membrane protein insertase